MKKVYSFDYIVGILILSNSLLSSSEQLDDNMDDNNVITLEDIVDKGSKGYTYNQNKHFYKISAEKKTWFEAFLQCKKDGGFLAIPDVNGEAEILTDMIRSAGCLGIYDVYYIGLHKLTGNKKKWYDVKKNLYIPGKDHNVEKSNLSSYDPKTDYNCGVLWNDGKFYDYPCPNLARYICEIS